jgi:hypothetical protein
MLGAAVVVVVAVGSVADVVPVCVSRLDMSVPDVVPLDVVALEPVELADPEDVLPY